METARIDLVLPRLRCPVCAGALTRAERTVRCADGHGFDLARQGYLTLLFGGGTAATGDAADMVAAREAFLARSHYEPIAAALVQAVAAIPALAAGAAAVAGSGGEAVNAVPPPSRAGAPSMASLGDGAATAVPQPSRAGAGPVADQVGVAGAAVPSREHATTPLVVDLAGGTGYYLSAVLDSLPHTVGIDVELSPYAARRAARAHPRMAAVRADVWRPLPLATGSAPAVLSIFGPRNAPEIARLLAPDGRLVVVAPASDHLAEIVGPLGMLAVAPDKAERLARQLADFDVVGEQTLRYRVLMTREDVANEARMGPSAHHLHPAELATAVAALPEPLDVTVAVTMTTYRIASSLLSHSQ